MLRTIGGLCCFYGAGAPQLPLQGGKASSLTSAVPSINHEAVHEQPIAPPDFVREVPASSSNGIGFIVYSFGGDLPHAIRGDAPADLHIQHGEMSRDELTKHIADTSIPGDQEVEIGSLKYGSQRMHSYDFTPCVPVSALYASVIKENADSEVPMALYHAECFARERLDGLLASAEHGQPTDIFVVTRNWGPENTKGPGVLKQSAIALYLHSKLPAGTKLHVIEVPKGRIAVGVTADKIEVWKA